MLAQITATTCVMDRLPSRDQDAEKQVTFVAADEDTGVIRRTLLLSFATWQDLGSPDSVTVTVVPGDALNPGDPS